MHSLNPIHVAMSARAALLGALLLAPSAALACSIATPQPHELDPDEVAVDVLAPEAPALAPDGVAVRRGVGPTCVGFECDSTSCDDLGLITVALTPGDDDRTPAAEQGFVIDHAGGTLPDGLTLSQTSPARLDDGTLRLVWIDDDEREQEPFDFAVDIVPVDLAGNEGESLRVQITDPGREAGCSLAGRGAGPGAWTLLMFLGGLARRRFARSCLHRC